MPRAATRRDWLRHPRTVEVAVALAAFVLAAVLPLMLQQRPKFAYIAVFGLAGLAVTLAFRPTLVWLVSGWLVLAPVLQEPARASSAGHLLQYALYELPPVVFVGWTWWLRGHRRDLVRPAPADLLPLLLLAFAAAGVLLSPSDESDTLTRLHDLMWNVGIGVLAYYVVAFTPMTRAALESLTAAILSATTLAGFVAVTQYLLGYSIWGSSQAAGAATSAQAGTGLNQGVASAVGTLGNPAVLGTVAGVGAVFAVSILTWDGPVRWRRLARVSLAVDLLAVVLSFERAPIIAAAVLALVLVLARRRLRLRALIIVVLLGATAAVVIPQLVIPAKYQARATNAAGIDVRLQVVRRSLQLAKLNPVLGNGYGSYDTVSRERTLATSTTDTTGTGVTSHNTLVTMLVEIGLLGILMVLAHWVWVVAGAVGALRRGLLPPWLAAGCLSGIAVVAINAMAIDLRFFSFVCVIPWLCFGLLRRHRTAG
jgi:O-antigen ligase